MDRERLKEVHQTDLTESRVNEEFIDWLRTKGVSWLLVVLLALCAYLVVIRWKERKAVHSDAAWAAYVESEVTRLPSSYEDVAEEYDDVFSIPHLARLRAADRLIRAVQTEAALGATDVGTGALTSVERTEYLDRADRLYTSIIDADDDTLSMTLLVVNALNGRAAIAESRGDSAEASRLYGAAAERARESYGGLAVQAESRAETTGDQVADATLSDGAASTPPAPAGRRVTIDAALRDLLLSDDAG